MLSLNYFNVSEFTFRSTKWVKKWVKIGSKNDYLGRNGHLVG